MGAFDLIKELRGAGVIVRSDGSVLDISPADRLTGEMIEALKRHKPEILALLRKEDAQLFGNPEQLKPHEVSKIINRPKAADTWKPDRCNRCIYIARFRGGNACLTDNGQALLYGFSYEVPDDHGTTCASWQANREETLQPTDWLH
jgi:hypothetical protein